MIIPLGPEDSVVRRHPVVCYSLAALNAVAFFGTLITFDEARWESELGERSRKLGEYVERHPYLEVPDEIEGFAPLKEELEEARSGAEPRDSPEEGVLKIEQAELDGFAHELYATIASRPSQRYGLVPAHPSPLALVTSMFMHGSFWHLFGNMLFLYIAGPLLEDRYGRPLFLALYLLSGAMGGGLELLKSPGSYAPVIGASGAIAGLMGAFLVRLTVQRIRFLVIWWFAFRLIRFTFAVPAFIVIPFWFLEDFIVASGSSPDAGGIAHAAHVGGFIFGAFAAFLIKIFAIESRWVNPAIEAETAIERSPAFLAAVNARVKEDWSTAREEIDKALEHDPDDIDALYESYLIALGERDRDEAGRTVARLLARYDEEGEAELAEELRAEWEKRQSEAEC